MSSGPDATPALVVALEVEAPRGASRSLAVVVVGSRPRWAGRPPALPAGRGPVVIVGSCGSLRREVRSELVLAESVVALDGSRLHPDRALRQSLEEAAARARVRLLRAAFAEAEEVVDPIDARRELHRTTGAEFVDLESAPLARVAAAQGRRWAVLRHVVDTPERSLEWLRALFGAHPQEEPAPGAILRRAARRPWAVPRLVELGLVNARGSRRAGRVLEAVEEWPA